MVKGRLLRMIPDARIVDITHEISPFDQTQAAYVVRHACTGFPEGTIHIIDVNAVETTQHAFIALRSHGQYYICTDNGMPQAVFGDDYDEVVELSVFQDSDFYTFAAYNLFCQVAQRLAAGEALQNLGKPLSQLVTLTQLVPIEQPTQVTAHVAYLDSYGNADLDLSYARFEELRAGRSFELIIHNISGERATSLQRSYEDNDPTGNNPHIIVTVSATGYLQVAMCRENAHRLFGLRVNDNIVIKFH